MIRANAKKQGRSGRKRMTSTPLRMWNPVFRKAPGGLLCWRADNLLLRKEKGLPLKTGLGSWASRGLEVTLARNFLCRRRDRLHRLLRDFRQRTQQCDLQNLVHVFHQVDFHLAADVFRNF